MPIITGATSESSKIIARLPDGRFIAQGKNELVKTATTDVPIEVAIPELKNIEAVISIEFDKSPNSKIDKNYGTKITGNIVGTTIGEVGTGTTITTTVLAIGR